MDPITHITAGVLIGQAGRDRFPAGKWLVPLAAFAAWLPDIDNVVTLLGPEAYMDEARRLDEEQALTV